MKSLSIILILLILTSCSANRVAIVDKTITKHKLTPTMKYFNKTLNSKKYGIG